MPAEDVRRYSCEKSQLTPMKVSCTITHESNDAVIVSPTSNAEFLRLLRFTYQWFLMSLKENIHMLLVKAVCKNPSNDRRLKKLEEALEATYVNPMSVLTIICCNACSSLTIAIS